MEYLKLLLIIGWSVLVSSHGHRRPTPVDEVYVVMPQGNGRGRGNYNAGPPPYSPHGNFNGDVQFQGNIPGYPMKGPPSSPYMAPQQPRGQTQFQAVPPGHNGRNQFPAGGQVVTVNQPQYVNNPFLPPRGVQNQNTFINGPVQQRPPLPAVPNAYGDLQNVPAIEPVTNDLPSGPQATVQTTSKPAYNPREVDLLYGSNLFEEPKGLAKTQPRLQTQTQSKADDTEPDSFDDRILIDSAPHCQEGYVLVGTRCRMKV